jgi:hypothetical protein
MNTPKVIWRAFLIADLSGYIALTEAHGNISAAQMVKRCFMRKYKKSLSWNTNGNYINWLPGFLPDFRSYSISGLGNQGLLNFLIRHGPRLQSLYLDAAWPWLRRAAFTCCRNRPLI